MESLAKKYPKYYKALPPGVRPDEVDVYVINLMFPLNDPTGCLEHARKKLLVPGVRSGGKSMLKDVTEARDTLNRFITLMSDAKTVPEPAGEVEVLTQPVDGSPLENGWFVHAGSTMPEVFDGNELVEVRLSDGVEYVGNFAKLAEDWVWVNDGMHTRIVAWRLLSIEQEAPPLGDWKEHSGPFIPEGLDPDEMVEVMLSNGHEVVMAKRADRWDWKYRSAGTPAAMPHISHWRRYRHQAV